MPGYIIQTIYFIGAFLLIFGLNKMSSPSKSQKGLVWTAVGMFITVLITYFHHEVKSQYLWMTIAIAIGGLGAYVIAKRAAKESLLHQLALFNGLGGGAVAAIATVELLKLEPTTDFEKHLTIFASFLGVVSFSGSLTAVGKLRSLIKNTVQFPMHQWINALVFVVAITFGIAIVLNGVQFETTSLIIFLVLSLLLGLFITLPTKKEDIPTTISLFNAFTGIAVGFIGYVIASPIVMIIGMFAGVAGIVLTRSMGKTINRPITSILFGNTNELNPSNNDSHQSIKELDSNDAAMMMAYAQNVIIVPGYGMAVAQAQHKIWDMYKLLKELNVNVKFAIHPAAGRMPGHMDVLLSEAGIPNDVINDLDEINDEFERTDVVFVLGGNDIVNTAARADKNSPIYGMPILNADYAKNIIIVKRGKGTGYSGLNNPLLHQDNVSLLYGDAQTVLNNVIRDIKSI